MDLAYQYRIRKVPTFVYVRDGREVRRRSGYLREHQMEYLCRDSWF